MAAFHPRTFELLRDALGRETAQNAFDRAQLDRTPESARSKRATALRERAAAYPAVSDDLTWLLDFMQRLNDQARRHVTECAAVEQDARATTTSVLSDTPLAAAFGAAPTAEDGAR